MSLRQSALLSGTSLLAVSCLAPPAILEARTLPIGTTLALYPPESRLRFLQKSDGSTLTALFVPAGEGAPIVLHLLDSSGSIGGIGSELSVVARQLQDLGLASLCFDYTGVGLSPGERSVANLLPDAELAWQEALRLAGGDATRVVLRGISIGTIAAAELLAAGARPRAVISIGPVFPRTVVPRFAREFEGWFAWLAASLFFRPVSRLDPCDVMESCGVPWHVFGSFGDRLVSTEEIGRLLFAASRSGGKWYTVQGDHVYLSILARKIGPDELELLEGLAPPDAQGIERALSGMPEELATRFPAGSQERERLANLAATQRSAAAPELAAAALANEDWLDSWRMLWLTRIHPFPALAFEDQVASLALPGRDGRWIDRVEYLSMPHDLAWRYEQSSVVLAPSVIGEFAANRAVNANGERYQVAYELACGLNLKVDYNLNDTWNGLIALERTPAQASLEVAQALLKSMRIPDRLQRLPDGSVRLEALWEENWEPVPYEPTADEPANGPNASARGE